MLLAFSLYETIMSLIFWDIETRSVANLREVGAWNYAAHAITEPLCLFFAVDDDEPTRWLPGEPVPAPLLAASRDPKTWKLIAHHHEFERAILEQVLIPRYGFPPIPLEAQYCTQQLALANAYPPNSISCRRRSVCPTARTRRRPKRCVTSADRASRAAVNPAMSSIGMKMRASASWCSPAVSSTSSPCAPFGGTRS